MKARLQEPAVFLVYVWPDGEPAPGFRASVRRVDRDQLEFFTHTEALADYFQREASQTAADDERNNATGTQGGVRGVSAGRS